MKLFCVCKLTLLMSCVLLLTTSCGNNYASDLDGMWESKAIKDNIDGVKTSLIIKYTFYAGNHPSKDGYVVEEEREFEMETDDDMVIMSSEISGTYSVDDDRNLIITYSLPTLNIECMSVDSDDDVLIDQFTEVLNETYGETTCAPLHELNQDYFIQEFADGDKVTFRRIL